MPFSCVPSVCARSLRGIPAFAGLVLSGGCAAPLAFVPPGPGAPVRTTLPLFEEPNALVTQASVGGRTIRLIVDTGGFATIALEPAVLEALDVEWTGRSSVVEDAFGNARRAREFELPELRLGAWTLRDVRGYELGAGEAASPPLDRHDGYLGAGLLRHFGLVIDAPGGRLELSRDAAGASGAAGSSGEAWAEATLHETPGAFMSTAQLDGRPYRCAWDTGTNRSVLRRPNDHLATVEDLGPSRVMEAATFEVGGRDFGPLRLVTFEYRWPDAEVIVGLEFFSRHVVRFDAAAARMGVRSVIDAGASAAERDD